MAKQIRLYDTYQAKVVDFKPLIEGEVSIYYCGPTVYNYVHIGNLRPVIVFDLLSRVMQACGYKVHMISNYTDIDDKIIKKALDEHKSEKEVSDFYIEAYQDSLAKLNIMPLEYHPRVSNYIPQIVDFIYDIEQKGHAYQTKSGDVYFAVADDPEYGSLSKTKISDLISGERVEIGEEKKSPLDFALWKNTDDQGIKFDSKIGRGRPGWHTECVVMINSYFKKPLIDIHGGGFDLKFPHHENEMAQAWAYAGTRLANIWMHVGFLNINNEKMSKSIGNVVLAKDAIARFGGNAIKHFFLTTYYRSPVNYTEEAMQTSLAETVKFQRLLDKFSSKAGLEGFSYEEKYDEAAYDEFLNYLADDLNVANALTVLDKVIKKANLQFRDPRTAIADLSVTYGTYKKMLETLGFVFEEKKITAEDKADYLAYQEARKNKDFAKSDELRQKLLAKGLL
jgi:cysteinyl-tRNA synthetase